LLLALPLVAVLSASPLASPPAAGVQVLGSVEALMELVAKEPRGPVIVHFWATWCRACVAEMPKLRKLQAEAARRGIPMVGVSMDPPEKADEVAELARREGLTFQNVILDAPDPVPVVRRFDPRWKAELPATFLALQSGEIVDSFLGSTPVKKVLFGIDQRLAPPAKP